MNPVQLSGLALIAFGATELFMRKGQAAKRFKRTVADRATTPLIFGCYALVVALFFPSDYAWPLRASLAQIVGGWAGLCWLGNKLVGNDRADGCHQR